MSRKDRHMQLLDIVQGKVGIQQLPILEGGGENTIWLL